MDDVIKGNSDETVMKQPPHKHMYKQNCDNAAKTVNRYKNDHIQGLAC